MQSYCIYIQLVLYCVHQTKTRHAEGKVMIDKSKIKKVVLAYSGGLDTSIIIPWLK